MTPDPIWIYEARKYVGQKEIAGISSNPWVLGLWAIVPWIWATVTRKDDSVLPWCGAFMRLVMVNCGITPPKKWWSANEWSKWGFAIQKPIRGCIGIMKRPDGAHVGIILGKDSAGNYLVLGGNQGDAVKVSAFNPNRFTAFVWPTGHPMKIDLLPILASAAISSSEA